MEVTIDERPRPALTTNSILFSGSGGFLPHKIGGDSSVYLRLGMKSSPVNIPDCCLPH